MTVPERVAGFLQLNKGKWYCDDCLQEQLKLKRRQQAQQITSSLAQTPGFTRREDICQSCPPSSRARRKLVTKAN